MRQELRILQKSFLEKNLLTKDVLDTHITIANLFWSFVLAQSRLIMFYLVLWAKAESEKKENKTGHSNVNTGNLFYKAMVSLKCLLQWFS